MRKENAKQYENKTKNGLLTQIKNQPLWVYAVVVCMIAGWLLVFPVGVFRDELISRTAADYSTNTGPIGEVAAIQEFVPQYDRIKSVGVDIGKLNGAADQGTLFLHFFDENLNEFASVPQDIASMRDGELTDIPVDLKLKAGSRYYVRVQCEDYGEMPPVLHYRSLSGNGPVENLHFYYGPVVIEDASANIRYIYEIPLNLSQILFYDSAILLLGAAVIRIGKGGNGRRESKERHGSGRKESRNV